jgi:futalosine hydrolase
VILVVAATELELASVEGAETLRCGIGPVEAALHTARALSTHRPDAILHIGIAGARTIEPPALVIGSEARYCDIADEAARIPRVETVAADPALVERAQRALPEARVLPIATCARVGGGAVCEVEAMEGFAVLRAAELVGVPAVEVRAISNAVAHGDRGLWRVEEALAALTDAVPILLRELAHA